MWYVQISHGHMPSLPFLPGLLLLHTLRQTPEMLIVCCLQIWPFALSELTDADGLAYFENLMFTSAVPNRCYFLMYWALFDQELFGQEEERSYLGPWGNPYNRCACFNLRIRLH